MKILVVGGAGYIGSHMVKHLLAGGYGVVTLDNLSKGYRDAVIGGDFFAGDIADQAMIVELMSRFRFDAVMHFASFIDVAESVRDPASYYQNNVVNTKSLLDAAVSCGIGHFVFSSTAAIFGEPHYTPIDEAHPQAPINPYGESKLMVEKMLRDYDTAYGLKSVSLRYFNAAGAAPGGELGERHDPETHLIPLVLQAASGRRKSISVFGDNYDTPDGTCIRDFIHVMDLCEVHVLALEKLVTEGVSRQYNLGNGEGFSVKQVIDRARAVTGREIKVEVEPRRVGDPVALVADATRAKKELGWKPQYSNIDNIIETAWCFEQSFFIR